MNQRPGGNGPGSGRARWGSYGFLAGMIIGLLLGWMFHGFVGAFVRLGLAALVIVPLVLAFLAWRRFVAPWPRPVDNEPYGSPISAIETRGVVREPRAR